jgi:DNA-binding transcriptional LysR family regulator
VQLHQVQYFLAAAEQGGVTAAAATLGLAKPTVSQAIRDLERELGVELFHRIGRGVVLTSAGHALIGPARRIMRDVVAATGALSDAGALRGQLDIYSHPALAVHPVARLVGTFRRQHPHVFIRIGEWHQEETAAALVRDGHCEIIMCHLPIPDLEGLEFAELGVQEYWIAFPPGTALPPDDPLPLSALPDIPLIVVPPGGSYTGQIEQAIAEAGQLRRPAAVVHHREAIPAFAAAGVGTAFVDRARIDDALARGLVVRQTDPQVRRAYGVVYDGSTLSRAGQTFVKLARSTRSVS